MARVLLAVVAGLLLAVGAVSQGNPPRSLAQQATPQAQSAAPVTIASEVLGHVQPVPVDNPELALARVTVMPGAALPVHYHPGSQIGVVVQGELTYTVFTGEIEWYRAGAPDAPTIIHPGETVTVRVGDALVESPGFIHEGRNDGDVPLIIYLSTLFPTGAPRAIIVDATPESG